MISVVQGKEVSNETVNRGEKSPRVLNGAWQTTSSSTVRLFEQLNSIPKDQWRDIILPAYSSLKKPNDILWFRTQVTLPSLKKGERLFLCCDGIKFVAEVWLNGRSFGGYAGGSEPYELDITSALSTTKAASSDGKNTVSDASPKNSSIQSLVIRVEGPAAIAKKEPDLKKLKKGSRTAEAFENSVMWPVGSQGFGNIGIWEPIRLEVRKSAHLDDLFIQTSVADKTIRVDGSINILGESKKDLLLCARVLPWKGSETVLNFDPVQLSLKKRDSNPEKAESLSEINNNKINNKMNKKGGVHKT